MKNGYLIRRILQFSSLLIGATVIFSIPIHLRANFYDVMLETYHLTNTQMGNCASLYALVAMICYLPGGWLADKFSPRKLLAFSYFSTGILTFCLLFNNLSYPGLLAIFAISGITGTLTFWSPLLKITRQFGRENAQGKSFGGLEGGRGVAATVILMGVSILFGIFGSGIGGFKLVVIVLGSLTILTGILTLAVFQEEKVEKDNESLFSNIIYCIKSPNVWLICFIVLGIYTTHSISQYIAPFASGVFGTTAVFAAFLSTSKQWLKPVGGFFGGVLADRLGISKLMSIAVLLLMIPLLAFIFIPGSPELVWMLVVVTVAMFTLVACLRGLYFANMNEAGIPVKYTGAVTGLASTIGFSADVFIPAFSGRLLDTVDAASAYRIVFGLGFCFLVIAFILIQIFARRNKENIAKIREEALAKHSK